MNEDKRPTELGTEKISKLLVQYAVPAIIAMVAASLYNITDRAFLGHGVGPLAISGLAVSFPFMNLSAAFGTLVGVGSATLLSIRMGQKDYETANRILGNIVLLGIIFGGVYSMLSFIFLDPILIFFGASEATLPYARDFMRIILLGNTITYLFMGLNAILRSAGNPQKAMYATIATVVINIILNPLFIFGLGWGIKGSALATLISQATVLLWQIHYFRNKKNFIHFRKSAFRLERRIVTDALAIGLSPFSMNAVASVIVIVINQSLLRTGGDLAVGAYGIINSVAFLFVMIVLGLNQGMQPIAGYNFGAMLYGRVNDVLKQTIISATVVMVFGFLFVELFPHVVASIFTTDKALVDLASNGLRIIFASFPIIGFQMVSSNFFQSIGMPKKSIFLSMSRQLLFLLPCLLIFPHLWGINGVWISMPVADTISSVVTAVMLMYQFKSLKTKALSKQT
ncbi:MAG: MATE family efflux transporter [Tannerella sp.]|jgi:putative MATE family efflux protein|nr:MATE family efflux transporter [Tannerella sp.]